MSIRAIHCVSLKLDSPVRSQDHVNIVRVVDLCQRIINYILELHSRIRDKQVIVDTPDPIISVELDRRLDIGNLIPDAERTFEMESEVVAMLLGIIFIGPSVQSARSRRQFCSEQGCGVRVRTEFV